MASFWREVILTSSPDKPITAHDPLTGTLLAHFSGSRPPRKGLALAGNTLIAASHISAAAAGFIRLYNWWSSAALHCIQAPEPVAPLAATPDGSYLFSGGLSGCIHAFSLPSGDLCRSFRAHRQAVSCLVVNDDGSLLISGGDDGTIAIFPILRLLDDASNEEDPAQLALNQFSAHGSSVTGIAAGPGGCNATVVSSSLDCTCKLWSLADGVKLRTVQFLCAIWCVAVDPTSSEFYAGGSDGRIYVVPLRVGGRKLRDAGAEVTAWESERNGAVMAVAMAHGHQNLISASEDGIIRIWDVESTSVVRIIGLAGGALSDLIVVKGINAINGARKGDEVVSNGRFCEREMGRNVNELRDVDECLSVAVKDRSRAIDKLEAVIDIYKRLLGLLLKEAKRENGKEEANKTDYFT
ncbi:protein ROOT INITIATION DEFECTIVE 3-like [Phoenix dactylifera]|uniref:Protein ROOT INITIATION DEFECTIVE 3-like n=1 Tax=Phoenix dactylifera TaxID=42345 RepID=A0A8B7CXQ5_PHODC|nr:protein ROOT INITIATION DEFECTIVE 3-like [Phoenix dactylifera]